jgi:hypothetical protein
MGRSIRGESAASRNEDLRLMRRPLGGIPEGRLRPYGGDLVCWPVGVLKASFVTLPNVLHAAALEIHAGLTLQGGEGGPQGYKWRLVLLRPRVLRVHP